jgi:hypothetical protein
MRLRIALAAVGVLLGLFGAFRLLTQISTSDLIYLAGWLVGAVVIHDGILAPTVAATGAVITRFVPPRARRYVQGALVVAALVTVIALPLIHRENSQPVVKAILRQNYAGNLAVLLGIIAGAALVLYAVRVIRDRQRSSITNERPAGDQTAPTV